MARSTKFTSLLRPPRCRSMRAGALLAVVLAGIATGKPGRAQTVSGLRPGDASELTSDVFPGTEPLDESGSSPRLPSGPLAEAAAAARGWVRIDIRDLRGAHDWVFFAAEDYAPKADFRAPEDSPSRWRAARTSSSTRRTVRSGSERSAPAVTK